MQTVNIHEAKTQLSRLIEQAGEPLVKVTRLDPSLDGQVRRLGFIPLQITVSDDFDRMGSAEIEQLFVNEG